MRLPRLHPNRDYADSILFIPAMLDMHFPLLKYAFYSKDYYPVVMDDEDGITDIGLKYTNHDMCYPLSQIVGQMIKALESGKYDVNKVKLLMPTAGDACRGANYTGALRRAMQDAGYGFVPVLTLNVRDYEPESMMKFGFAMVWRAMFGLYYGDILMVLLHATRPYEIRKGAADRMWKKWIRIISQDMMSGKNLSLLRMHRNFRLMCRDFSRIRSYGADKCSKQVIGLVGELYVKYCHLGNWDVVDFVEQQGAEIHVNPLSYYALYYMDTHMIRKANLEAKGARVLMKLLEMIQKDMLKALTKYGYFTLPPYWQLKKEAHGLVNYNIRNADGWLIGAEAVGYIRHGVEKVFAAQPFGCMVNHCAGRGLYPSLTRRLGKGYIVSTDVDASASKLNYYNRLLMLIHGL